MRIPNLSLYLRMVEFEFETYKFEFETENKIFCEYQPRSSCVLSSRRIPFQVFVFIS